MKRKYQIAIYLRLSREDPQSTDPSGWKKESSSIVSQRNLLCAFAKDHFTEYELLEFCDDGFTGTNMEREGMQQMLAKVKQGRIDCILVKDFSRFSRDYIVLGTYLEQIFPFLQVRFISVNDHYDSSRYPGRTAGLEVNFQHLLYDLYSKDLSKKVSSSLSIRKEQGEYVSSHAPFGYEKAAQDRHHLVIAEEEAEIVRMIFSLAVAGWTSVEIAKQMNKEQRKTPVEFKIEKGKTHRNPKGERFLWNSSMVCSILKNEVYVGNSVQKKYKKDIVGGKNHLQPRQDWLIEKKHHPPIISEEVFAQVQKKQKKIQRGKYGASHPLTGKVICGGCCRNLTYRKGKMPYFTCCLRYTCPLPDCVTKILAETLEEFAISRLKEKMAKEGIFIGQEKQKWEQEIEKKQKLERKLKQYRSKMQSAYEKYVWEGTETFFQTQIAVEEVRKELQEVQERLMEMKKDTEDSVMTKEMADHYIDKIIVTKEQKMKMVWKL